MDKVPKVQKLNNQNYFTWKYKLELLLINEDLWEVITDEPPTTPTRLREWRKRDNKARSTIGLTVEDSQLVHIRGKSTALETWNALKNVHEKDTITNRVSICNKIALLRMKENDSIEDHLNQMIGLFQQLSDLGDDAGEEWKIGMVFASLPHSYSTLVTALEARPSEDLKWSLVYSKLIDEYQRQREIEDNVLRTNEEKVMKINLQKNHCYFCKKNSHRMADCYQFKRIQQFQEFEKYQQDAEKIQKRVEKPEKKEIVHEICREDEENDETVMCIIRGEIDAEKSKKKKKRSNKNAQPTNSKCSILFKQWKK